MTQRPSGWYDDPEDPAQLRYWDGILWSDRRMPRVKPGLEKSQLSAPPRILQTPPTSGDRGLRPGPGPQGDPWRSASEQSAQAARVKQAPTAQDGEPLSGWRRRALAVVIDYILATLVGALVALPWTLPWLRHYLDWTNSMSSALERGGSIPDIPENVSRVPWQLMLANILVYAVYEIGMTRWRGQTLGKIVTGIRVRRADSRGRPDLAMSATRFVVKMVYLLVGLVPLLGVLALIFTVVDYLWPLREPSRRAMHDLAASTCVARTRGVTRTWADGSPGDSGPG